MLNKIVKTIGGFLWSLLAGLFGRLFAFALIMSVVVVVPYLAAYGVPGIIAIVVYIILIPVIMVVFVEKIKSRKSKSDTEILTNDKGGRKMKHVLQLPLEILLALLLWAVVTPVFAEVSDKVARISDIWGFAVIASLVCFAAVCFFRWKGLAISLIPLLWFGQHLEFIYLDDDIGAALHAEQGDAYFVHSWLAALLFLLSVMVGYVLNRHRKPKVDKNLTKAG
ncbi:hypothetical protein AGMMS50289_00810 [Betaproteobacteria bacterium]|nr:hypothetical protein AGMMS50289_00810 [Betaproteobacteria bacterium]